MKTETGETYDDKTLLITDHGRFEGQPRWVAHFFKFAIDGEADDRIISPSGDWVEAEFFLIRVEDRQAFPEIGPEDEYVCLRYSRYGYVRGSLVTAHTMQQEMRDAG